MNRCDICGFKPKYKLEVLQIDIIRYWVCGDCYNNLFGYIHQWKDDMKTLRNL